MSTKWNLPALSPNPSSHSNIHNPSKQDNHCNKYSHSKWTTVLQTWWLLQPWQSGLTEVTTLLRSSQFALLHSPEDLPHRSWYSVRRLRVVLRLLTKNATVSQTCGLTSLTPPGACCLHVQWQLAEYWTHVIHVSLSCKIILSSITSWDEARSSCQ